MKTCPKCGNKYRPDVAVCPNDGTPLSGGPPAAGPPAAGPPTGGPPPESGPPASVPPTTNGPPGGAPSASKPKPKPSAPSDWSAAIPSGLRETSTARSWIFALLASLVLIGGFMVARDRILGPQGDDEIAAADGAEEDARKDKKKRKKRRKGKRRKRPRGADEESYDDYDWSQDYVEDDTVFGDVFSDRANEVVEYEEEEYVEPEPYEPTRDEYQPDGSYRPTASYAEPGAKSNVVTLDLSSGSSSAPLDESQVNSVLNVRRLSPCYDRWVQKIPQMKGRVWMSFVVAPDGHVAAVEITRSQLRSRVVEKCLVKRARGFKFPRSEGGQRTKFDTHFDFTNR